jgi:hypothetical protein
LREKITAHIFAHRSTGIVFANPGGDDAAATGAASNRAESRRPA